MFFTKEDYLKIAQYLKSLGVRDTDIEQLNQAQHPLTGKETFVLVKDGVNVRVTLNDIYVQFPQLAEQIKEAQGNSTFGIYNVSQYGINTGAFGSLTDAIDAVPLEVRRTGLYITYYDESYKWHTWQMIGQSVEEDWDVEHFVDYHQNLQYQLDSINSSNAKVTLTASPSIIYVGDSNKRVHLTLTSTVAADTLEIKQGNTLLESDTVDQTIVECYAPIDTTTTYTGIAQIKGTTKSVNTKVSVVDYIKYGAMMEYNSNNMQSFYQLVTTPSQTYNITVPAGGGYIYLYIPSNVLNGNYSLSMNLVSGDYKSAVTMGIVSGQSNSEGKLWKSASSYDPGTFQFEVTTKNN